MDQPYSPWADWLDKFHTSPDWIQALWLVVVPLALVGIAFCVMRAVREITVAALDRRGMCQGRPVYAIYQAPDGRWLIYARGAVRELKPEDFAEQGRALPGLKPH